MDLLSDGEISRIHAVAVSAGLSLSRSALLSGNDPFLLAGIPIEETSDRQMLADLRVLNGAGKLTDGAVPLETWLKNAQFLSGLGVESDVFRRSAERCRSIAAHIEPEPLRSSWGVAPSLVSVVLNQIAPAARRLAEDSELMQFLDAATRLGFASLGHREALLAGIPSAILDEIPRENTPIGQMALDVAVLGRERFAGLPLLRWLANACVLTGPRSERATFSSGIVELVARAGILDPGPDLDPPLAINVERIIDLAATYTRPHYQESMFAGLDMPPVAPPHWGGSASAAALLCFYRLHAANPGRDGEAPFLRWLSNLRVVAKVKRTDPIAAELSELEARYVRRERLRS